VGIFFQGGKGAIFFFLTDKRGFKAQKKAAIGGEKVDVFFFFSSLKKPPQKKGHSPQKTHSGALGKFPPPHLFFPFCCFFYPQMLPMGKFGNFLKTRGEKKTPPLWVFGDLRLWDFKGYSGGQFFFFPPPFYF